MVDEGVGEGEEWIAQIGARPVDEDDRDGRRIAPRPLDQMQPAPVELFGDDAMALAGDVRDAALRALDASNPAAAMVTLELAYCSLRGLLNRLAGFGMPRAA